MYFVCEKENEYSNYFKELNYEIVNFMNIKTTNFKDESYVIFNIDENTEIKLPRKTKNIYLIKNPIVNTKNVENYLYYLPATTHLFFNYLSKYNFKLLFPINITKDKNFCNYYCNDIIYKNYGNLINGTYNKRNHKILLYNDISELETPLNNLKIFNIKDDNINENISNLNNYLNLTNKYMETKELFFPSKFDYEKITIVNYYDIKPLELKKNKKYLIFRTGTNMVRNSDAYLNNLLDYKFNCFAFLINSSYDYELLIYYSPEYDQKIEYFDLFSKIEYIDTRIIGINNKKLLDNDIYKLYYNYGKNKIYQVYKHLSNYEFTYYDCIIKFVNDVNCTNNQHFNKNKFMRILSFWSGSNNYELENDKIKLFMDNNNNLLFNQKRILLASKIIKDYGGNQNTAYQLYRDMIKFGYDVKICCISSEDLISEIDKFDVIMISNINEIIDIINNTLYDYIIVNKLDEFLTVIDKLTNNQTKKMFITHNSMDPVNKAIIEKSNYLDKVLTINYEHINLFYENKINCIVDNYINHIKISKKINQKIKRTDFKYKVLFIGRISKEKNIDLLVDAFNLFTQNNKNINLTVIGDGKLTIENKNKNKNITFLGRCDKTTIEYHLINSDYLILPSSTEGLPFVFLEAMNLGIPIISSNIVGLNELLIEDKTGFMFDILDYDKYKNNLYNWDILEHFAKNKDKIILNLVECLNKAYSINIEQWNNISENCYRTIKYNYEANNSALKNLNILDYKPYAFISNKSNSNYFIFDFYNEDSKLNYNKYKLVIKYDIIKLTNIEHNIIPIFLNKIYKEMIDNKIKKIIDNNNNFIISNSNFDNIKVINSIDDIFLF